MGTVVGTLLVFVTWAVCALTLIALGLLPARLGSARGAVAWRAALWWGLLIVTLFVYAANLVQPLRSSTTAWAFAGLVIVLGALGLVRMPRPRFGAGVGRRHFWILWTACGMTVAYLALAALGPVTNYDSGLYHLGAIQYAGDYSTIPGLANLFAPLGYANAEFPLAALLGNGPWNGQGFRLLNGLLVLLVILDLAIRGRSRRLTPGFFVLAVGLVAALVPMIALADYWVTSPTQDSAVLMLTIIACAYLADAMAKRRAWLADAATVAALCLLLILFRQTMVVFAFACLAVIAVKAWRARRALTSKTWTPRVALLVVVATALAGGLSAARDYVLSGWLEFPLSFFHFSPSWLVADPSILSAATLGYHRDRDHLWEATHGWDWVGPWVSRLPSQWETFEFALLMISAAIAILFAMRHPLVRLRWRTLALVLVPSALAVVVWWVALPPSFRFIWGPLFMLPATVIGWVLWCLYEQERPTMGPSWLTRTVLAVSIPVVLVSLFSLAFRSDFGAPREQANWSLGLSIPYSLVAVRDAAVAQLRLGPDLVIEQPTESDQCWSRFPLCTPSPADGLQLRGRTLREGFLP